MDKPCHNGAGPTWEQMLLDARQNLPGAWDRLVARLEPWWRLNLLRYRNLTEHDAEDVLQSCLLRLHKNLHRYRPELSVSAGADWLRCLINRGAITFLRYRERRPDAACLNREAYLEEKTTADPRQERQETRHELENALRELVAFLPRRQSAAIELRYLLGMSYEEIAAVLGVATSTAFNIIKSGEQMLRRYMAA